ncbi:hypothetical protein HPNQ4228_0316 [Helicobacter pylori NQ4228]|nr:hypothetical protein HPNQ4228_0316 [Helicobacter pylori NQ4228]
MKHLIPKPPTNLHHLKSHSIPLFSNETLILAHFKALFQ